MQQSNRLCFDIIIGDEDGPSFLYTIDNSTNVGACPVKVTCHGDNYIPTKQYIKESNLTTIIKKYNIVDVMELHDWYDFITPKEARQLEREICSEYTHPILPKDKTIEYVLVTIIEYNVTPSKYLIPKQLYKSTRNLKQFIARMEQYKVTASYRQILQNYAVIGHNYYLYDLIEDPKNAEVRLYEDYKK